MTLPSRRTLLLAFGATLLIVVPYVRAQAARDYCEGLQQFQHDKQVDPKPGEVSIDACNMWDLGITNALRWSFDGGILTIIVAAWSYSRDRRQAKRQSHPQS